MDLLLHTRKILTKILKYLVEQGEGCKYISFDMESWPMMDQSMITAFQMTIFFKYRTDILYPLRKW